MMANATKQSISVNRRQLLHLMQRVNFGRIEGIPVRDGEPQLGSMSRVVREVRFGGKNGRRDESSLHDFYLKAQVIDLFSQLEVMDNGRIEVLEVQHGLPFRMSFEESVN
jgi:hypothetical protein